MRALVWFAIASGCGRFDFDARDARVVLAGDSQVLDDSGAAIVPYIHLSLDEPVGATSLRDASPNGFDANIPYPADVVMHPTGGKVGGAAHFDGVAYKSVVAVPSVTSNFCSSIPMLTGSLTVSAWVNFESFHDWLGYSRWATPRSWSARTRGDGVGWGLGATNGCRTETIGFVVASDIDVFAVRCGATMLAVGDWHFLTGVYDAMARTMTVYLDGADDDGEMTPLSGPVGGSIPQPEFCPYLGTGANEMQLMVGLLDEVTVFDRALTAPPGSRAVPLVGRLALMISQGPAFDRCVPDDVTNHERRPWRLILRSTSR